MLHFYTPYCVCVQGFFQYGKHPNIIGPVLEGIYDDCYVSIITIGLDEPEEMVSRPYHDKATQKEAIRMAECLKNECHVDLIVTSESYDRYGKNFETLKDLWKVFRGTPMLCLVPDEGDEEIKKKYVDHTSLGMEVINEHNAKKIRERVDWHLRKYTISNCDGPGQI